MLQPDDLGNESHLWHSEWNRTHGPQETQPQEYKTQGAVPGMEQGGRIKSVGKVAWKSTLSSVQSM